MRDINTRGYFGIGIENTKNILNVGTLWRSAIIMGADYIFTIGKRYKHQSSDTMKAPKHIPLFEYENFDSFYASVPKGCRLVGIELDDRSVSSIDYKHPERCCYLLGAEDHGLTTRALSACHDLVQLPGDFCLNVSTAGSIIMYDRLMKKT